MWEKLDDNTQVMDVGVGVVMLITLSKERGAHLTSVFIPGVTVHNSQLKIRDGFGQAPTPGQY